MKLQLLIAGILLSVLAGCASYQPYGTGLSGYSSYGYPAYGYSPYGYPMYGYGAYGRRCYDSWSAFGCRGYSSYGRYPGYGVLIGTRLHHGHHPRAVHGNAGHRVRHGGGHVGLRHGATHQENRASCRERVWQDVSVSVVAVYIKKKNQQT